MPIPTTMMITEEEIEKLFCKIVLFKRNKQKLVDFIMPADLEKVLETRLNQISSNKDINEITDLVLDKSIDTSNSMFLNQLYGGANPIGLAASFLIEKMNTNAHTYEVAPIFVLTERIILRKIRHLFFGSEDGDGIFSPGGSLANFYAIVLARHRMFPETKKSGLFGIPPLVIYTSEDSHYSISKVANWMSLGLDNVIKVKTNKNGQMIVSELEKSIQKTREEGKIPLLVNSTAGTTVLGAFDPFKEIAKICEKENIWHHCDAAWGGSFIFSDRLKTKHLDGIELCDSIVWNAHKMLGCPLQCSIFITKKPDLLANCNSASASYLFQQDKFYPVEYDSGDKSVQCGRKCDSFKLYYMWAILGSEGFRDIIESHEDNARYITEEIKRREGYHLYIEHQSTNVFFWYIPKKMRDMERNESFWVEMGKITAKIKEKMVLDGRMMIGYSPLPHKNINNAIRLVISGFPKRTHEEMIFVLDSIEKFTEEL